MMSAEQLRNLCRGIRRRGAAHGPLPDSPEVNDLLVHRVESDIDTYRITYFRDPVPQLPPEPLRDLLPLMGWLIYEASLDRLWEVKPRSNVSPGAIDDESTMAANLVRRLADAARGLVWPEFAPRALGAIRAQALVESKRDDEAGFDAAWEYHREAEDRYNSYLDSLGDDEGQARFVLDLDEVLVQLALAETGTACRTAERVIGRWDQDFEALYGDRSSEEQERWMQRMFVQLTDGIEIGERALGNGRRIRSDHGVVYQVTEERLTLPTGLRNPAIMTCRAMLLAYSLCPAMEELGRIPPLSQSWADYQNHLLSRFNGPFEALCDPVQRENGEDWPLSKDHCRSLVQLCLYLGLIAQRHELPCPVVVDETLTLSVLDDDAVEAMSAWLVTEIDGGQRGDANMIGTASMPEFIASIEACRRDSGPASDYRLWRLRYPDLDRYSAEPGRAIRIARILRSLE